MTPGEVEMEPEAHEKQRCALRHGPGTGHSGAGGDTRGTGVERGVKHIAGNGLDVRIGTGQQGVTTGNGQIWMEGQGFGVIGW